MSKKAYRVRNWSQYNKSLVKRGDLTFWFSPDLLDNWETQPGIKAHGNQKYSAMVIICALTLRQLFRLPLRATEGLMASLLQLLDLKQTVPHYSTLCRRSKTLAVPLSVPEQHQGLHVLIDSTGVQIIGESEWKYLRYGVKKCRYQTWRKLHIAMDATNQNILAATITGSTHQDGSCLPDLVDRIKGPISQLTADGAYDKTSCYEKAYEIGAKPIFPPQHNAAPQRNLYKKNPALLVRDAAIQQIGRGADRKERLRQWKVENNYHQRSLVETMMFRMKTIFGDQLRSKCLENQATDLLLRCRAINKINTLGLPLSKPI